MTEANENLVLLEIDFPGKKDQSDELKKQNNAIFEAFNVQVFPTLLLCDSEGRPYADLGSRFEKSVEGVLKAVAEKRKMKIERDRLFASAEKAKGTVRAELLVQALNQMPRLPLASAYRTTIDQIKESDPDDESGFLLDLEIREAKRKVEREVYELSDEGKGKEAEENVDEFISKYELEDEAKQKTLSHLAAALEQTYPERAIATAEKTIAIDDTTKTAAGLRKFVTRLKKMQKGKDQTPSNSQSDQQQ